MSVATRPVVLVLSVALAGCGGAEPHPVVAHVEAAPPPATTVADTTWSLLPNPAFGRERTAFVRDGDGWVAGVERGRVRVSGDHVVPAARSFASPIHTVAHLGAHWLFVTRAGEIFRASEPLGDPTLVGTLGGRRLGNVVSSTTHLAILDEAGDLWIGDGDAITRVESNVPHVDAAFVDARVGVRVELTGRVTRTIDAGRSWSEVALGGGGVPYLVYPTDTQLVVETSAPSVVYVIGRDGPAVAVDAAPHGPSDAPPTQVSDALARYARSPAGIASPFTPSGRALWWVGDGTVQARPGGTITTPPDCARTFGVVGERFVAHCNTETYVSDGASEWTSIYEGYDWVAISPDGVRWATAGACDAPTDGSKQIDDQDADEDADEDAREQAYLEEEANQDSGEGEQEQEQERGSVCLHDASGAREINVDGEPSVVGFVGDRLLVALGPDYGQLVTIDLAAGDHIAPAPGITRTSSESDALADDGTFYGRLLSSGEHAFEVGPLDARVPVTIPDGTNTLLAADATHLVAFGQSVYLSSDAGRTFTQLAPGPLDSAGSYSNSPVCGPNSCLIGDWVWAAAPHDELPPLAQSEGVSYEVEEHEIGFTSAHPTVTCEPPAWLAGHPTTVPLPALDPHALLVGGGWLQLGGRAHAAWEEGAISGALGGLDDTGAPFHAAIQGGTLPAIAALEDAPESTVSLQLQAVSATLAVVERCRTSTDQTRRRCDLLGLPTGAAPFVAGDLTASAQTFLETPTVTGSLVLADGSIAVLASSARSDRRTGAAPTDVLFVLRPDGTFSSRVVHVGTAPSRRTLARDGHGNAGVLVARGPIARWIGADGSVGPVRVAPPRFVESACEGPAADDALDIVVPFDDDATVFLTSSQTSLPVSIVATLAPNGTTCVRTVAALSTEPDLRGALQARASAGQLVARTSAPGVTTVPTSTCRVVATADSAPSTRWQLPGLAVLDGAPTAVWRADPRVAPIVATLHGDAWSFATPPTLDRFVLDTRLVARARTLELLEHGTAGAWIRGASTTAVTDRALAVVADGDDRITLALDGAPEATDVRLVAQRGDTVLARSASFAGRVPLAVYVTPSPSGAGPARGVVVACRHERVYGGLEACVARGFAVDGSEIRLLASIDVDDDIVNVGIPLAPSEDAIVALVGRAFTRGHPARLEILALDGARSRTLLPAIASTAPQSQAPMPLAIALEPPRIAYVDARAGSVEPTLVRVVELRDRAWYDLGDPWANHADPPSAVFTERGLLVTSTGFDAASAILENGTWHTLTMEMPTPPAAP